MKVLDLFCGGGGAAEGYMRAGYAVVGIDIDPQPCYPAEFHRLNVMEALQPTLATMLRFNYQLVHASPPCQPYSKAVKSTSSRWNDTKGKDEPALIEPLREALRSLGLPYVIENVPAAPLDGFILCGSMFGLDIPRHRVFETNLPITPPEHPACHGMAKRAAERRGWEYRDMTVTGKGRRAGWSQRAAELLDIRHPMRQHDLKEAIPPAYTEYIGRQAMAVLP